MVSRLNRKGREVTGGGRDRQLSLFGQEPASRSDRSPVGPVEVPAELEEIARKLPSLIRLGTSSWSFPGWNGLVYDRAASKAKLARHGLAAYARHPLLRAVGIDRTFYAPIGAEQFAEYADAVPDDFRFLVKASSLCLNVHPRAPEASEQRRMCETAVEGAFIARWMLGAGSGYEQALERYEPFSTLVDEDPSSRELLARCCVENAARGFEVVVVANNKAEGSAPLSIFRLAEEIIRRLT